MLAAGDMVSRYQAQCLIPAGATDIYWACKIRWYQSPSHGFEAFQVKQASIYDVPKCVFKSELWELRYNRKHLKFRNILTRNVSEDNDENNDPLRTWNELQLIDTSNQDDTLTVTPIYKCGLVLLTGGTVNEIYTLQNATTCNTIHLSIEERFIP